MTNTNQPTADSSVPGRTSYGVLFSHVTEIVWADLIGPTKFGSVEGALEHACGVLTAQPGLEYAIMTCPAGSKRWRGVGTQQTPEQVIAERWDRH